MYENPITIENLKKLQKIGWQLIEPRVSRLACGDVGKGALAKVETIVDAVAKITGED